MLRTTALITGCSRGLGLEMVKQLCQSGWKFKHKKIIATCRNPDGAKELLKLRDCKPEKVVIHKLDVTDYEGLPEFVETIEPIVKDRGLGLLVNNAGVSPSLTRLTTVSAKQMNDTYNVNVTGPLMLTKALLPLMKVAAETRKKEGKADLKPLVVNMGSYLGSVHNNDGRGGGIYAYRTSKSALNMLTRSLSLDLGGQHVHAVVLHPGWVKTDLGGPNAPVTPEESVAGMLNVLQNFRPDMTGGFYDFEGNTVEW